MGSLTLCFKEVSQSGNFRLKLLTNVSFGPNFFQLQDLHVWSQLGPLSNAHAFGTHNKVGGGPSDENELLNQIVPTIINKVMS